MATKTKQQTDRTDPMDSTSNLDQLVDNGQSPDTTIPESEMPDTPIDTTPKVTITDWAKRAYDLLVEVDGKFMRKNQVEAAQVLLDTYPKK